MFKSTANEESKVILRSAQFSTLKIVKLHTFKIPLKKKKKSPSSFPLTPQIISANV